MSYYVGLIHSEDNCGEMFGLHEKECDIVSEMMTYMIDECEWKEYLPKDMSGELLDEALSIVTIKEMYSFIYKHSPIKRSLGGSPGWTINVKLMKTKSDGQKLNENSTIGENSRVMQLAKIQQQALELFTRKNADYGDAFAKYGLIGVLMRIEDKIQRCMSITKNGINLVSDEGLKDTLLDLHNYAAMATMLYDENELIMSSDSAK
jgi:hypothetical protein